MPAGVTGIQVIADGGSGGDNYYAPIVRPAVRPGRSRRQGLGGGDRDAGLDAHRLRRRGRRQGVSGRRRPGGRTARPAGTTARVAVAVRRRCGRARRNFSRPAAEAAPGTTTLLRTGAPVALRGASGRLQDRDGLGASTYTGGGGGGWNNGSAGRRSTAGDRRHELHRRRQRHAHERRQSRERLGHHPLGTGLERADRLGGDRGGAAWTRSTAVTLSLAPWTTAAPVCPTMRLSANGVTWGSWEAVDADEAVDARER